MNTVFWIEGYPYRERYKNWKRPKCIWWWVPIVWRWISWAKVPTVYLQDPEDHYDRVHELGHVVQWHRYGRLFFLLRYLTFKGRLHLEAECTAKKIKAMVDSGGWEPDYLIDYYAKGYPKGYYLLFYNAERCEAVIRDHYTKLVVNNA